MSVGTARIRPWIMPRRCRSFPRRDDGPSGALLRSRRWTYDRSGESFRVRAQPLKTCHKCGVEKELSEFEKKVANPDGYRGTCKSCRKEQVLRTKNAWRSKNLGHIKGYQREYRLRAQVKILASRPIPTCPLGHSNLFDFRWINDQWVCRICSARKSIKARLAREKQSRVYAQTLRLQVEYGRPISDAYSKLHRRKPNTLTVVPVVKLLGIVFPMIRKPTIERIYLLNRLSGLPVWNIGWTCKNCRAYSENPAFFDIDHISPRHKGGPGIRTNLQALCPNCHRVKTLQDLSIRAPSRHQDDTPFLAPYTSEKTGRDASVDPVQCMPIPPRGNTLAECQPGNPRREETDTAALEEITSPRSGPPLSSRQAHSPRSTHPQLPAAPTGSKTEAATKRPN